jgi:hypothetical protein
VRTVRRQHQAARGEGSTLLQMQIGDDEGSFRIPIERAGGGGSAGDSPETYSGGKLRGPRHCFRQSDQ